MDWTLTFVTLKEKYLFCYCGRWNKADIVLPSKLIFSLLILSNGKRIGVQIVTFLKTGLHIHIMYLTNRFQVSVRLFSNRSQRTSKCGKNKKVAHEAQPSVSLMFLPHFDVICDLLLNRRTATWNLFVLYYKELKYTEKAFLFQISPLWQTRK